MILNFSANSSCVNPLAALYFRILFLIGMLFIMTTPQLAFFELFLISKNE